MSRYWLRRITLVLVVAISAYMILLVAYLAGWAVGVMIFVHQIPVTLPPMGVG